MTDTDISTTWEHKDIWKRTADKFTVEISRHHGLESRGQGPHRWCVYGYVYPKHWLFPQFDGTDKLWQPATEDIPMHGGILGAVTLIRYHRNNAGDVCSVMFGADYNHLHDDHFTHMETPEEASEVFADAEQLYKWLSREAIAP